MCVRAHSGCSIDDFHGKKNKLLVIPFSKTKDTFRMTERTDAPILLRLAYQAMLKAGLPVDAILLQARVSPAWLDVESPERTPFAGQARFWRALE